jgi:hypothetical protein
MVLYRSTIFFIACASCLGFLPTLAVGLDRPNPTEKNRFASSQLSSIQVETEDSTLVAIAQLSKSTGIHHVVDDIALQKPWKTLDSPFPKVQGAPQPIISTPPDPPSVPPQKRSWLAGKGGWIVFGAGVVVVVTLVGGLFYLLMRPEEEEIQPSETEPVDPPIHHSETDENAGKVPPPDYDINGQWNLIQKKDKEPTETPSSNSLVVGETARLKKIDIIDELIRELQTPDPSKRRKTIWELGQRGDSRAIQPLVNLMIDSDSKQRSLILAALSEIGTRTLQPMNRALVVSLQDENAEVRKNAIRDLTRIYDLVAQMSQILRHAVEDSDAEVQETARWALGQLNHIRGIAGAESRSTLPNPEKPSPDSSVEDSSRNG